MKRREVKEGEKKEKQGQYWQLQFRGGTPHPVSCTPPLPCTPRPSPSSLTHPIIKQYRNYITQQQKFICQQRQDRSVQMSWINPELSVCSQSLRVSQSAARRSHGTVCTWFCRICQPNCQVWCGEFNKMIRERTNFKLVGQPDRNKTSQSRNQVFNMSYHTDD